MQITWLGTAGFKITTGGDSFLIDPYLTRNKKARPVQTLGPRDLGPAGRIFISHGHFDHLLDAPAVAAETKALVYCDPVAASVLVREGLSPDRIVTVERDGQEFEGGAFRAKALFSRHVKFDKPLVLKTLVRAHVRLPRCLKLLKQYPAGQVLAWRFSLEGRTLLHFGSAGSAPGELERLAQDPPEVLMVPLQGHTHICRLALEYVRVLQPACVIPHHHDDFYPPVSQMVDISPFVEGTAGVAPRTKVVVPELNQPFTV
ncbi:MAG: MBL fold metallo-hydrolase [Thermodesulfobacteriota bacterium]